MVRGLHNRIGISAIPSKPAAARHGNNGAVLLSAPGGTGESVRHHKSPTARHRHRGAPGIVRDPLWNWPVARWQQGPGMPPHQR